MYFNMRDTSALDSSSYSLPSNVHVCTGPDDSLGSDYSIQLVSPDADVNASDIAYRLNYGMFHVDLGKL